MRLVNKSLTGAVLSATLTFTLLNVFAGSSGTTLDATKTAVANWTRTDAYHWTITKTTPPNQVPYVIPTGGVQQVTFTVTAVRSGPEVTSWSTPVSGEICVTNTGTSSTSGLYIVDQLEKVSDSSVVSGPSVIPVAAELAPSQHQCYPYSFEVALDPSIEYRNHAIISLDNYLGFEGTSHSIDVYAAVIPTVSVVDVDSSARIEDIFNCPSGFTCTPSSFSQTVTGTTTIPYLVTVRNDSAACGQNVNAVNTAQLFPSTTQIPQIASASISIYTGTCAYQTGDFCTYSQGGWGGSPNGGPGRILADNFATVYPTGVEVGIPGAGGYSMQFTSSAAVGAYLPANSTAAVLNADLINPLTSSSGVFGGQILALQINVDFNNANIITGTKGNMSSLILTNTGTSLDGQTVAQILAVSNTALGGGVMPSGFTPATLNTLVANLDLSFDGCTPSEWAQTHLVHPAVQSLR
jgi:hypothetical protein